MFEFQSVRRSVTRNLTENSEAASFPGQTTSSVEKKGEEETKSMPHAPVIYADGSNNGDIISPAAVFRQLAVSSASSIISTKANTILVALKFVVSADKSNS
jgi:hypothetical protein